MKIARSGQALLLPFQQLLDSPPFWTPKYALFPFWWLEPEPEPEPKPELEIGLPNCKLDPLLFGFKASRKFPNCGSVDANSELNGPVVTSKDGIAGTPKGSGFGFVGEEDETEQVNGGVAEDEVVVEELFLLDDEDRFVLLREPPPTGMLRRVPPLVQYLRQLLQ